ncbi:DUF305 domain-containing protein [Streptomonospora nanhaiensis]|uniref:Uncharacterized protein (DUF305 family) n=1 Tax=Streptomonospora nanhaiensis TaxID=1323731 RepID=A0A853BVQ0_9ACTN|nr:DUF305 domain-containing protein [Streptomonospora nanhaiensis]MBV2364489.1 DUF305 domain-containing protein [Streptomonospora nanhaiensis]NYI99163.1 uncharacterized protein (DUF305 family) [Streptomonospora nanhaiensis]
MTEHTGHTEHTLKRVLPLLAAAVAAALTATACGGTEPSAEAAPESSAEAAEFNDSDVMFAQMMIPHHEQAVEMAHLAEDRAGAEVRDLAAGIEAAQGPEIEQLTAMLESWGEEPLPEAEARDHGMAGMLTDDRLAELERAEGGEFDTLFLEMMIAHHEGAVQMAAEEIENGVNPEAVELAESVVEAQEAEIEQMNGMLGGAGSDSDADAGSAPEASTGPDETEGDEAGGDGEGEAAHDHSGH